MTETGIEGRKRGAPWILIVLMVGVAIVIGWWLWSHRTIGSETVGAPGGASADSVMLHAPPDTASR